jgi:hypothetical protein
VLTRLYRQNLRDEHFKAWHRLIIILFLLTLNLKNTSHLRSKQGRFQPGILDSNFKAAADWAQDLGYAGNFQLAVDDTKITKAVRTYLDGDKWKVAGMHGTVETFVSYEELIKIKDLERSELAEKVFVDE